MNKRGFALEENEEVERMQRVRGLIWVLVLSGALVLLAVPASAGKAPPCPPVPTPATVVVNR